MVGRLEEVEARKIPEDPDYAVTRDGRVFSNKRGEWAQLQPSPDSDGYLHVSIGRRKYAIHTLVLEAFVGPCPEDLDCCRHLNGNKTDNHVDNLCWGTDVENAQDAAKHRKMREAGELPPLPPRKSRILNFRIQEGAADAYGRMAAAAGMTRNEWVVSVLNAAAGLSVLPDELKRQVEIEEWSEDDGEDSPKKVRDGNW